jgi:hypothetical protein
VNNSQQQQPKNMHGSHPTTYVALWMNILFLVVVTHITIVTVAQGLYFCSIALPLNDVLRTAIVPQLR